MGGRFRTLDPAMLESPQLDGLSLLALLLIDRLIQAADDEGRQFGDEQSVWRSAFPRGNAPRGVSKAAVVGAVSELEARRLVVRYEIDGLTHLALPGWKDGLSWQYQNVSRPKPSRHPEPPRGTCLVRVRGMGNLPPDRSLSGHGDAVTPHGGVGADLDVDVDVEAKRPDVKRPDADAKRDSPSPSPAEAVDGASRSTNGKATNNGKANGTTTRTLPDGVALMGEYKSEPPPSDTTPIAEGLAMVRAAMSNSKSPTETGGAR